MVKDALMDGGYHLSDVTVHIEPADEAAIASAWQQSPHLQRGKTRV
jgi:hypothetical protein